MTDPGLETTETPTETDLKHIIHWVSAQLSAPAGRGAFTIGFKDALIGVVALGGGLAVLAGATGTFDQLQRDNPQGSALAFGLAALAGVLLVAAGLLEDRWEKLVVGASLIILLAATVLGITLLMSVRGHRPAPTIAVALRPGNSGRPASLSGSISVDSMTSREVLKVRVLGRRQSDAPRSRDHLFDASVGPSTSGELKLPLEVEVARKYAWVTVIAWVGGSAPENCFQNQPAKTLTETPGCVVIRAR